MKTQLFATAVAIATLSAAFLVPSASACFGDCNDTGDLVVSPSHTKPSHHDNPPSHNGRQIVIDVQADVFAGGQTHGYINSSEDGAVSAYTFSDTVTLIDTKQSIDPDCPNGCGEQVYTLEAKDVQAIGIQFQFARDVDGHDGPIQFGSKTNAHSAVKGHLKAITKE